MEWNYKTSRISRTWLLFTGHGDSRKGPHTLPIRKAAENLTNGRLKSIRRGEMKLGGCCRAAILENPKAKNQGPSTAPVYCLPAVPSMLRETVVLVAPPGEVLGAPLSSSAE